MIGFLFPYGVVLFAAVCLAYALGKRASGQEAGLVAGLRIAGRKVLAVALCALVIMVGLALAAWPIFTLPIAAYLGGRIIVLPAVLALEDRSGLDSLRRAWELTQRDHVRSFVLALVLILPLLIGFLATAAGALTMMAGAHSDNPEDGRLLAIVLPAYAVALASLLWVPVVVAAQTVAYVKLRRAHEGPA